MEENKVLTDEQKTKIDAEIKEILPLIEESIERIKDDGGVMGKALTLLLLSLGLDLCNEKNKKYN